MSGVQEERVTEAPNSRQGSGGHEQPENESRDGEENSNESGNENEDGSRKGNREVTNSEEGVEGMGSEAESGL